MSKITRRFTVEVEVDADEAKEFKNGQFDMDAYPNFDINYGDNPSEYIDSTIDELKRSYDFSGMRIDIKEV